MTDNNKTPIKAGIGYYHIGQIYILYMLFQLGLYKKENPDARAEEIVSYFLPFMDYEVMEEVIQTGKDPHSHFGMFLNWYANTSPIFVSAYLYIKILMNLPPELNIILESARRFGKTEFWLILAYNLALVDWKSMPFVNLEGNIFNIRFFYSTQKLGKSAFDKLRSYFVESGIAFKPSEVDLILKVINTGCNIMFATVKSISSAIGSVIHLGIYDEAAEIINLKSFQDSRVKPTLKHVKTMLMSSTSYSAVDKGFAGYVNDPKSFVVSVPTFFNPIWFEDKAEIELFKLMNEKPNLSDDEIATNFGVRNTQGSSLMFGRGSFFKFNEDKLKAKDYSQVYDHLKRYYYTQETSNYMLEAHIEMVKRAYYIPTLSGIFIDLATGSKSGSTKRDYTCMAHVGVYRDNVSERIQLIVYDYKRFVPTNKNSLNIQEYQEGKTGNLVSIDGLNNDEIALFVKKCIDRSRDYIKDPDALNFFPSKERVGRIPIGLYLETSNGDTSLAQLLEVTLRNALNYGETKMPQKFRFVTINPSGKGDGLLNDQALIDFYFAKQAVIDMQGKKSERARVLQDIANKNGVIFMNNESHNDIDTIIEEVYNFSSDESHVTNGYHDDMVDCLAYASSILTRYIHGHLLWSNKGRRHVKNS